MSGVLILFFLSCMLFLCSGEVNPPPGGTRLTFLNGSTATLQWSLDGVSGIRFRTWNFKSSDGSAEEGIAEIIVNDPPLILNSSLPRVSVKTPATLILHNVTEKYNGTYKLTLAARSGSGSSEVVVYIAVTPSVWINCSRVTTVNTSDDFTCVCKGEGGNPPAEVTWYKGNKTMATGVEEATLRLRNVTKDNYGNYTCEAKSHEEAKNETEIILNVNYKPVGTTIQFTQFSVLINESVTITCASNGLPKPNFIISHNDTKVASGMTYTIPRVNKNHSGTYKCVARNFLGYDSASRFLHVLVKPNVTINCSSPINVREGDYFICQCLCKDGIPPANCTWLKNGAPIDETEMEKNTLVHRIYREDGGNYTCVGRSHARAQDKKSVNVSVYYTTIKFSENPAIFDESVNMTCSSHGLPAPRYVIYYNDSRVVASNMTYTISRVNWTHAGTYKCVANNALKNDSASSYLNVTKPTKSSTTIKPSNTTTTAIPSSSIQNGTNGTSPDDDDSDKTIVIIVVVTCCGVTIIVIVGGRVIYIKCNGSGNECDVNPNGSKVITNHYELEEDQLEGGGNTYDTAKPPDKGEGSQNNAEQKLPGDSLPPVYASVDRENRQGNTLYASLDSEALKRPSQKKPAENQPKIAPTEYASIDFMKTAKTPNDDSVST
ncbi:hemicentin-1-like [Dendronephthya gigantea]|uniref:hemicentin-1-like n=1 Tax=Dendronephthya gigantea TaxID=151771 RepID=UPI00106D6CAA|nr:hemicentin-1-like [Dendronephthya gigantea]XP_028413740.1 hemicentin-1-like [Dendronephthya gigantea]XP_028413741.1 hemicentin-1-like [Dendronephthya gigantea]XP_028413743.1 hemicentin-1-like [Dendronephthya gigantea]